MLRIPFRVFRVFVAYVKLLVWRRQLTLTIDFLDFHRE
jgi:hypothetical protein